MWRHGEKAAIYELGRESAPETSPAGPRSGLLASRAVRENSVAEAMLLQRCVLTNAYLYMRMFTSCTSRISVFSYTYNINFFKKGIGGK